MPKCGISLLTKALDNVPGTAGNDTIIGSIDSTAGQEELNTLSSLDIINGGAGTDTLKIAHGAGTVTLGNLSNVEIVEVESAAAAGATVNTSTVAGVTNLNVTKAAGAVVATAAATTDVNVAVKGIAGTTVTVNGGKDVTVTTTDAADAIDVGATGTDPVGAVTITATGAAVVNNAVNATNVNTAMGNISVGGGKTVNVTQKAGAATNIVADGGTETVVQGNVTVTANATTTDVTVKQDAAVTAASRAAVTGVTEVASVKFTKLDAGESVTISGLTFTAAAGKDLSADQVAQAFANLSASAIKPTDATPATATGDTNGGSASANGTFTGSLAADWTSGAATGDTVVFTGKANTAMATDLATTTPTKATVTTTTQGVTAVSAQNTLGVTNGTVTIAGAAALKTVTVDGYAASTGAAGINGATNTALDTISLANGGNFEIDSAAATLGLTLNKVNGTVTVTAGTKTLNADVNGAATDTVTLVSGSAEAINVTGAGNVAGTTATGLTAATAINTTGMTAGNATFTIANGTTTSYTGGAGVDSVTVSNAGTAITKAIDLGAGDDTLTLTGAPVVAPTATLKGGDGTDTIAMSGASAEALSANTTFAGKIEGFEKLYINDTVAAATTVNMANMDGITYVVSNGSAAVGAGAVAEQQTYVLTKGTDAAVGEQQTINFANLLVGTTGTIVVGGVTVNVAAGDDAAAIGDKVQAALDGVAAGSPIGDATVTDDGAGLVTVAFAAADGAQAILDVTAGTAVVLDTTGTAADAVVTESVAYNAVGPVAEEQEIDFAGLAAAGAGDITVGGITVTLTAGMTPENIATAVAAALDTQTLTSPASGGAVAASAVGTVVTVVFPNTGAFADITVVDTDGVVDAVFDATTDTIVTDDVVSYDSNAGNITVAGATIAVTAGLTADQLGATIAANEATIKAANANVDTVVYDAASDTITITYTTAAGALAEATIVDTATVGINAGTFTESRAYAAAGAGVPALTIDKMANNGTLELVDAAGNNFGGAGSAGAIVKMADATGSTDSLNLVTKVSATDATFGTVDVAGVETLKLNAIDTVVPPTAGAAVDTATLNLKADKATSLTIEGNSNVTLTLDTATTKLATINASTLTGNLTFTASGDVVTTITGGSGADVLRASGTKADVINGGAGNDTIFAGNNGAKLTGDEGNDLFIVTSAATNGGNLESNTYSHILDFQAGDLLQLQFWDQAGGAQTKDVTDFAKLTATLDEDTAQFSDFVNAAIKEAGLGDAVWFNYKGSAYIAIDSNASTDAFVNGDDLIVKLTGINGDNLSWNSDFATVALI